MDTLSTSLTRVNLTAPRKWRFKIGLDFGTTFTSAVAKSEDDSFGRFYRGHIIPFHEYKDGPSFSKNNCLVSEIPTCILYHKDQVFIGAEAIRAHENEYYTSAVFIERFKLCLDDSPEYQEERDKVETLLAEHGYNIDTVLRDFCTELFKSWLAELRGNGVPQSLSVQLNCAVPAAWKTPAPVIRLDKAIAEAALQAGLCLDQPVKFWAEPIAATQYMLQRDDKGTFRKQLQPKQCICFLDVGGGTGDLVSYLMGSTFEEMTEIMPPAGSLCGSEFVDIEMSRALDNRLRESTTGEVQRNLAVKQIMRDFKRFWKDDFHGNEGRFRKRCYVANLEPNKEKSFEKEILVVEKEHMLAAYDPVIDKVCKLLDDHVREAYGRGINIDTVVLLGGFSASHYLRQRIRDHLKALATELKVGQFTVHPITIDDSAIAEGTIHCSDNKGNIKRINFRSIGIIELVPWDPSLPGHPADHPPPDEVTGQYWVEDRVKFLVKKYQEARDPKPYHLYRSFPLNEKLVEIHIPLVSSGSNDQDGLWRYDERNNDLIEWENVPFLVDVSSFQTALTVYDEDNPEPWAPKPSGRSKKNSLLGPPRRSPRTPVLSEKAQMSKAQSRTHGKAGARIHTAQSHTVSNGDSTHVSNGSGNTDQTGTATNGLTEETETLKRWHTIEFTFHMQFIDGYRFKYELKCVNAPLGQNGTKGHIEMS